MFNKYSSVTKNFDHCLIVMSGANGSGKSTLAVKIQEQHPVDCYIVSKDEIRQNLISEGEDFYSREDEAAKIYYSMISEKLKTYKYVIADDVQITLNSRRQFFDNVIIPENTKIISIWVEAGRDLCKERNNKRIGRDKVPEAIIDSQFQYKVSPREEEIFNVVYFMIPSSDLGISSHSFHVNSIEKLIEEI